MKLGRYVARIGEIKVNKNFNFIFDFKVGRPGKKEPLWKHMFTSKWDGTVKLFIKKCRVRIGFV
jgi:hypothetical protein